MKSISKKEKSLKKVEKKSEHFNESILDESNYVSILDTQRNEEEDYSKSN